MSPDGWAHGWGSRWAMTERVFDRVDALLAGLAASRAFMWCATLIIATANLGMAAIHVAGRARMSVIDRSWWIGSNTVTAVALMVALIWGFPKLATLCMAASSGVWGVWGVLALLRAQNLRPPGTLDPGFTALILSALMLLMTAAWSEVRRGPHDSATAHRPTPSVRVVGLDSDRHVDRDGPLPPAGDAPVEGGVAGRDGLG